MKPLKIFLPITLCDTKELFLKGYVTITDQDEYIICITKCVNNIQILDSSNSSAKNIIYGHFGETYLKKLSQSTRSFKNWLELDENLQIKSLVINSNKMNNMDSGIVMLYECDKILNSEVMNEHGDIFHFQKNVQSEYGLSPCTPQYQPLFIIPYWLSSSMFIQHTFNYINMLCWLIFSIKENKKVFIRQGNIILAIIVDLILGYMALTLLTQDKKKLSIKLMGVLEELINMLYSLLKWLMGSPAGFKLNNEFNKMLGKYFSYHVQLWWLFLDVSGEKLDLILHIYHYMGYLGFTFQAAVISDMICLATFHSYCIYVYAARMFNIQISGLIALLRFFVGRKYNPLRGGIDSCEYTNQELFVGTVAFTILLLLLPTTAMYYIVFTLFRLLSLAVQYTLSKLIYLVQTFPLYALLLWFMGSPKVAGNIRMEVLDKEKASNLVIKLKLLRKSIWDLINHFKSPVDVPMQFEWSNILSNVFVGKQII